MLFFSLLYLVGGIMCLLGMAQLIIQRSKYPTFPCIEVALISAAPCAICLAKAFSYIILKDWV